MMKLFEIIRSPSLSIQGKSPAIYSQSLMSEVSKRISFAGEGSLLKKCFEMLETFVLVLLSEVVNWICFLVFHPSFLDVGVFLRLERFLPTAIIRLGKIFPSDNSTVEPEELFSNSTLWKRVFR